MILKIGSTIKDLKIKKVIIWTLRLKMTNYHKQTGKTSLSFLIAKWVAFKVYKAKF